jgi:hypothetical protein
MIDRDVLEIFADAAHVPSHLRERRAWRAALLERDAREKRLEQERFSYHHEFSFRRSLIEPLPWSCACTHCRRHFGHEQGLLSHLRCRRVTCSDAAAEE